MTKPHVYDYTADPHSAATKVTRMVGLQKRVLELGPGPGSITRMLQGNACGVTGLELDPSAIELVRPYCDRVYECNLDDPAWPSLLDGQSFDVIVAADVLEHLKNPWGTLKHLRGLLIENGYVVVSLPHLGHCSVLSCLLQGEFEYQPWGLLDRTHIRFFGFKSIQTLFEKSGFKIVEAEFVVKNPEQTEFSKEWRNLPSEAREMLQRFPYSKIYQVVVKAVPKDAEGEPRNLDSFQVGDAQNFKHGLKGSSLYQYLVSHLDLETRRKISGWLRRQGSRN